MTTKKATLLTIAVLAIFIFAFAILSYSSVQHDRVPISEKEKSVLERSKN